MDRQGWLNSCSGDVLPAAWRCSLLASLKLAEEAARGLRIRRRLSLGARCGVPCWPCCSLALIGQRLWRLRRDLAAMRRARALSRRLLLTLVLLAVPPVVVVYGFALRFSTPPSTAGSTSTSSVRSTTPSKSAASSSTSTAQGRAGYGRRWPTRLVRRFDAADADHARSARSIARRDPAQRVRCRSPRARHGEFGSAIPRSAVPDSTTLMRVAGEDVLPPPNRSAMRSAHPRRGAASVRQPRAASGVCCKDCFRCPSACRPLAQRHRERQFRFPATEVSARIAQADLRADPDLRACSLSVLFAVLAAFGVARRLLAPVGRLVSGHARGRRRTLRYAVAGRQQRRTRPADEFVQPDDARTRTGRHARATQRAGNRDPARLARSGARTNFGRRARLRSRRASCALPIARPKRSSASRSAATAGASLADIRRERPATGRDRRSARPPYARRTARMARGGRRQTPATDGAC